jgi:ABC-type transport system involved in cytochrome bd biosynthesis fused ATPase/permease subunit
LTAEILPGRVTVLTGGNGVGKSTALRAVLGLQAVDAGEVWIGDTPVAWVNRRRWWASVAWVPQRPVVLAGTLRCNLEAFGVVPGPCLERACADTGFDAVLAQLPDGWDTVVGPGGVGLSAGQRQRLALARALASDRGVLLVDEPTAHLDADSEAAVLAALVRRAHDGATVVLVGHRPAVLAAADTVVEVESDATQRV